MSAVACWYLGGYTYVIFTTLAYAIWRDHIKPAAMMTWTVYVTLVEEPK